MRFSPGPQSSAKVQKVGKGLPRQRWPLPRQSYDYTGCGLTYTRAYKASTTLPPFETFADGPIQAIMNLHPHAGQFFSREFSNTLTQIFSIFRPTRIHLEWCPPSPTPQGRSIASSLPRSMPPTLSLRTTRSHKPWPTPDAHKPT